MSAVLSDCRRYRYQLTRTVPTLLTPDAYRRLCVIMLNPSTADEERNDPTINALLQFAEIWRYSEIKVVNLYALRATDPKDLFKERDRVGLDNDTFIRDTALMCGDVLLACGNDAEHSRLLSVLRLLQTLSCIRVMCLGITKKGYPRHPLYVKRSTPLKTYDVSSEGHGWQATIKPIHQPTEQENQHD